MLVEVNDAALHVIDRGPRDAMPVVFVHGYSLDHRMWSPQLDALSGQFRVVAYDTRGHGQSSVGDGQYMMEDHADDLLALCDALQLDQAVLIGLSMGGYIVMRALEQAQGRFRAAVLCDTRAEVDTDAAKRMRHERIRLIRSGGSTALADEFLPLCFGEPAWRQQPAMVATVRAQMTGNAPLGLVGNLIAMAARTDYRDGLARLMLPVQIIVGALDQLTPPSAARTIQDCVVGSELVVLDGAGHMSNLECASAFNASLLPFLQRVSMLS